jgi:uncharacterized membrane protein YccC
MNVVRGIVREATRMNPGGIEVGFGIRCAAGVAIPLLGSIVFDHSLLAVAAAIGAFNTGFASRQGVYRTKAAIMLLTCTGMALAAFSAATLGSSVIASTALAVVWAFGAGILASLGQAATIVGLQTLIALAIFSQFHDTPAQAAIVAGMVFAGGALQTLLLVVVWPLTGFSAERKVLAAAYRALAGYAGDFPLVDLRSPSTQAFEALRERLADPKPFARRGEIATFESLLAEAERIRASLAALATHRYVLERSGEGAAAQALVAFGEATSPILRCIAEALESGKAPDDWDDSWETLDARIGRVEHAVPPHVVEDARALLGQLRAAWRAAEFPAGGAAAEPARFDAPSLPSRALDALQTLRANCSPHSAFAQHGLRLALVLAVANVLAHVLPLQRGYWIALTAVIVLRPDFTTTFTRGVARLIGTFAGSIVASLVVALLHPGARAHLLLALAFATFAFMIFNVNYAFYTAAITGWVVFLLAFSGMPEHTALVDRIEATIVGGALALAAYAFWPTWERDMVPMRLAGLLEAQRRYCMLVLGAFMNPAERDDRALDNAQLATWRARSNAEASVDRMLNEPVAPTALTVRAALGLLAASRRFGLALLSLRARTPEHDAAPESSLRELAGTFDTALAAIAQALRERRPPAHLPPLRDLQLELAKRLGDEENPRNRALVFETDLIVDSTNTMAELLARLYGGESARR